MSNPFGDVVSQLLKEASGSIPYNIPDESINLESVKGLRSELDNIVAGVITIDPATIDHDLLLNFLKGEHFLQSAIKIPASQVTSGTFGVGNYVFPSKVSMGVLTAASLLLNVVSKTANYTAVLADSTILCDAS